MPGQYITEPKTDYFIRMELVTKGVYMFGASSALLLHTSGGARRKIYLQVRAVSPSSHEVKMARSCRRGRNATTDFSTD